MFFLGLTLGEACKPRFTNSCVGNLQCIRQVCNCPNTQYIEGGDTCIESKCAISVDFYITFLLL